MTYRKDVCYRTGDLLLEVLFRVVEYAGTTHKKMGPQTKPNFEDPRKSYPLWI